MSSGVGRLRSDTHELNKIRSNATNVTEQSVNKTREMFSLINECKDAGVNTLQELYEQGDQLKRTETILDETTEELGKAQTRINNIETANNICCCCVPCLSCFQQDPDRVRSQRKHSISILSKERSRKSENGKPVVSTVLSPKSNNDVLSEKDRFFPKILGTAEEEEIESNLGHISNHLTQLKGIALDMNTEVGKQNEQIDGLNQKTENATIQLDVATKKTTDLVNDTRKSKSDCCCCCSIS